MEKEAVEQKIKEITRTIVEKFQPEKIILFGSWAWGKPNPNSDVDFFIVKEAEGSTRAIARAIDGSIFPRPFPIDVIVYTPKQADRSAKTDFFIRNILQKGRVLYAK